MAHSYVTFRNRDLHLNDFDLVPVMAMVLEESYRFGSLSKNIQGMLDQWRLTLSSYASGCIQTELDKYLVDNESIGQLLVILDHVKVRLDNCGEKMAGVEVTNLASDTMLKYLDDYPTSMALTTIAKIRDLIDSTSLLRMSLNEADHIQEKIINEIITLAPERWEKLCMVVRVNILPNGEEEMAHSIFSLEGYVDIVQPNTTVFELTYELLNTFKKMRKGWKEAIFETTLNANRDWSYLVKYTYL